LVFVGFVGFWPVRGWPSKPSLLLMAQIANSSNRFEKNYWAKARTMQYHCHHFVQGWGEATCVWEVLMLCCVMCMVSCCGRGFGQRVNNKQTIGHWLWVTLLKMDVTMMEDNSSERHRKTQKPSTKSNGNFKFDVAKRVLVSMNTRVSLYGRIENTLYCI
jgi:hypothetical protein